MFNYSNFHKNSFASFKACKKPKREPDFISPSGSEYWYSQDKNGGYVIRFSDHWGSVASCLWKLFCPKKYNISDAGKVYLKYLKNN